MKETKLIAKPRTAKGSASAGRLRRTGWFPAVVYGEGRPGVDIQLNEHDFVMMLRSHRSENMIVDLTVEGTDKPYKVMLKAMQHHPITGRVIHVDFYEVSMTRKIEIEVPVKLAGIPTGVANEGGILEHVLRALTVQCLPGRPDRGARAGRDRIWPWARPCACGMCRWMRRSTRCWTIPTRWSPPWPRRARRKRRSPKRKPRPEARTRPEVLTEKKEEEGEDGRGKGQGGQGAKAPPRRRKRRRSSRVMRQEMRSAHETGGWAGQSRTGLCAHAA